MMVRCGMKWEKLPQKLNKGQIFASPAGEGKMTRKGKKRKTKRKMRKKERKERNWYRH